MNILIISSGDFFSTYGGGQTYVKNIVDFMIVNQMNLKVQIISIDESTENNFIKKALYKNIPVYALSHGSNLEIFRDLLKKIQPDIVHAHGAKSLFCSLCHDLKIPIIVTAHHGGILCPAGTLLNHRDEICHQRASHHNCLPCCLKNIRSGAYWYPFMRLLSSNVYQTLGKSLKKLPFIPFLTPIGTGASSILAKSAEWQIICDTCTQMIAPSKAIAEAMKRNGMPEEKIVIVPHGIPKPDTRPSFPDTNNGIHFFYVGRICHVKGIHVMLQAFDEIIDSRIHLHLIGGAANKSERRYRDALTKKYSHNPHIIWHGKIKSSELPAFIAPFHVLIHPAIYLEVFGLDMAEALAFGKYVLATQCGGEEMQIIEGKNGWLASPNSSENLRIQMNHIIENFPTQSPDDNVISIRSHVNTLINLYEKYAKS